MFFFSPKIHTTPEVMIRIILCITLAPAHTKNTIQYLDFQVGMLNI